MNSRVRNLIVPVAILFALAPATAAQASGADVVRDCAADGTVGNGYSQQEYKDALNQIPADLDDYSDCRSIIASKITGPGAKAAGANRGGGSGGSAGGRKSAAAKKRAAVKRRTAVRNRSRAKRIRQIAAAQVPGADRGGGAGGLALQAAGSGGSMPLPLVLALAALGLLAIAGGVLTLQRRSTAFASALRRVPIPRRGR